MFPGCIDAATGRLRIRDSTPLLTDGWNHGVATDPAGSFLRVGVGGAIVTFVNGLPIMALSKLFISTGAVANYLAGWGFAANGSLCYDDVGAIARYNQGIPQTAAGKLAVVIV